MFSNVINEFIERLTQLGHDEAHAAYEFLEQAKKQLGITEDVMLIRSHSKSPNMAATWLKPQQGARALPAAIIVTDGAVEALNNGGSLRHGVSEEIKSFLGHELSHLKDGKLYASARKLPLFAMPMAFAAGYYLLDKALHKSGQNSHVKADKALQSVMTEEKRALDEQSKAPQTDTLARQKAALYDNFLRYGGMLAAAGLGLGTGLVTMRHLSLAAELRADRTAALLTGKVEPWISALRKIEQVTEQQISQRYFRARSVTTSPDLDTALKRMRERIKSYWRSEMAMLDFEVAHAHPLVEQRAKALYEFKNSPDFRARIANNAAMVDGQLK